MNPIQTNKPTFFGNDGDVLKSGQIFIGQPNQWPIDFPKAVTFQDSAGTQFTAQQPLTTNSQGQISYNGKAIIALVDGNYSMLVRDRNGVVVNDGYTPFIENTDAGGGGTTNATQVGTLLSDIKQFNVTPGDTVRNVGKTTALDDLGAYWLVVSNTGNPADDVDLIDFTNGTQGQRIDNTVYSKDIGTAAAKDFGQADGNVADIEYQEVTVDTGDFSGNAFTLKCLRQGRRATLWTDNTVQHASTATPTSNVGEVPAQFRPASLQQVVFSIGATSLVEFKVLSDGAVSFEYRDWAGATIAQGGTGARVTITYGL